MPTQPSNAPDHVPVRRKAKQVIYNNNDIKIITTTTLIMIIIIIIMIIIIIIICAYMRIISEYATIQTSPYSLKL